MMLLIYLNPLTNFGQDFKSVFKLKKEIVLQQNDKSFISSIHDCFVDSTGIFIVDSKLAEVKLFDNESGQLKALLGKKGNGPGEFITPVAISVNNKYIFVSDIGARQIKVFDKKHLKYKTQFYILDGREIKAVNNRIYSAYDDLQSKTSLHIFTLSGNHIEDFGVIPRMTLDYKLVSDGVSFDYDNDDNIYEVHEMAGQIYKYNSKNKLLHSLKLKTETYKPVKKGFNSFYSKEKSLNWIKSWSHLVKISVLKKSNLVILSYENYTKNSANYILNIYTTNLQPVYQDIVSKYRLLFIDLNDNLYFLDQKIGGSSIKFIINKYGIIK